MEPVQRRKTARKVEIGGQVGAAVAGTGLGAAKLRDAYKEDHPAKFARGLVHLKSGARKAGASATSAKKLVRVAAVGKPHFAQIALGATAAGVATGAQRYQSYSRLKQRRDDYAKSSVAKSDARMLDEAAVRARRYYPKHTAALVPKTVKKAKVRLVPLAMAHSKRIDQLNNAVLDFAKAAPDLAGRAAHIKGIGRVTVLHYHGNDHFMVMDRTDSQRLVHRNQMTFLKPKKIAKSAFDVVL